ncbi:hypothetical protein [Algoriphagus algorifonticola]|uniref:hypothetical protein n=1 Tax=Algoriphagus algorifonticola TaxID=2593007 RepID=UPI0011A3E2C0|nr:hypothetical protein [Algoriphagus algorifonticola]
MKKTFTSSLLGLVISCLLLASCSQLATFENEDLMLEQTSADKAGFKLSPFGTGIENARTYAATDCENFCIDPADPEYSVQTSTISNNSGPQTRVFTYSVYNTLTGFQLDWSYTANNNAGRKLKITVSGAGLTIPQSYTTNQLNGSGGTNQNPGTITDSYNFPFNSSWAACGIVTIEAEILDGENVLVSGPVISNYNLIGECEGCDIDGNEFSGDAVSCAQNGREAVYTFGSEDGVGYFKMQGGLTNFTGDNASIYINGALVDFNTTSSDGWATGTVEGYTVGQRTPGGSSNRNIRVEGGLNSCEEVEVRIVWSSSNSGSTITGDWSVKDEAGVDLAPEVAGLSCS